MFTLANTDLLYSCCLVKIKSILFSFLHKAPVALLQSLSEHVSCINQSFAMDMEANGG